jgi:hypothetical protein
MPGHVRDIRLWHRSLHAQPAMALGGALSAGGRWSRWGRRPRAFSEPFAKIRLHLPFMDGRIGGAKLVAVFETT